MNDQNLHGWTQITHTFVYGCCCHFNNQRFKQTQHINDCSAAHAVVLFVSNAVMTWHVGCWNGWYTTLWYMIWYDTHHFDTMWYDAVLSASCIAHGTAPISLHDMHCNMPFIEELDRPWGWGPFVCFWIWVRGSEVPEPWWHGSRCGRPGSWSSLPRTALHYAAALGLGAVFAGRFFWMFWSLI